jgi:hypothetical protein
MPSDFVTDLVDHKRRVAGYMQIVANELFRRAATHDNSKFSPEEFEAYDQAFPQFKKYAFGSLEMNAVYESIKPALQHHFQENDHHPEYYEFEADGIHGIDGMNLISLIEMVCDWLAASHRSQTGIKQGLEISKKKYHIDDQLFGIIKNTVDALLTEESQ